MDEAHTKGKQSVLSAGALENVETAGSCVWTQALVGMTNRQT